MGVCLNHGSLGFGFRLVGGNVMRGDPIGISAHIPIARHPLYEVLTDGFAGVAVRL